MAKLTDEEILIRNEAFAKGTRPVFVYVVRADVAHAIAPKDGELMPFIADRNGNIYVKDEQIPDLIEALGGIQVTNSLLQILTKGISVSNSVKVQTKVVSCPATPIEIQGIGVGAEGANDVMGTITVVEVPTSGIIYSATFFDLDYEKTQVDLEIFNHNIIQVADNGAWSPSDRDILSFVTELAFFSFDDHITNATSELVNIGKAYVAPEGKLYIQAVCRGTPTIAAGSAPRFKLQILSDDPNWQEK